MELWNFIVAHASALTTVATICGILGVLAIDHYKIARIIETCPERLRHCEQHFASKDTVSAICEDIQELKALSKNQSQQIVTAKTYTKLLAFAMSEKFGLDIERLKALEDE